MRSSRGIARKHTNKGTLSEQVSSHCQHPRPWARGGHHRSQSGTPQPGPQRSHSSLSKGFTHRWEEALEKERTLDTSARRVSSTQRVKGTPGAAQNRQRPHQTHPPRGERHPSHSRAPTTFGDGTDHLALKLPINYTSLEGNPYLHHFCHHDIQHSTKYQ